MEKDDRKVWIVNLLDKNPIQAMVAMLLTGMSIAGIVIGTLWAETVKDKNRALQENVILREQKDTMQDRWRAELRDCQDDLIKRLDAVNAELKLQAERYSLLNQRTNRVTNQSSRLLKQASDKIKQIEQ